LTGREEQIALRFSLVGTAIQALCGLIMLAVCAYLVFLFGFRFEELPEQARRSRNQLFWDFLRGDGGTVGMIVFAVSGLLFSWWTMLASWRFLSEGKAAAVADGKLTLHPSYWPRGEIALDTIVSAEVRSEGTMPGLNRLKIRLVNGRVYRLRSIRSKVAAIFWKPSRRCSMRGPELFLRGTVIRGDSTGMELSGSAHDQVRMSSIDPDEIRESFDQAVNMTSIELEAWLATEESRKVGWKGADGAAKESVGHASGRRIVTILRKVVGYVRRHLAQRPENQVTSRWRYSLMNWGHDPIKG